MDADPLVKLEGYGHMGGKLPTAAAVLETAAKTTATTAKQSVLESICADEVGLLRKTR